MRCWLRSTELTSASIMLWSVRATTMTAIRLIHRRSHERKLRYSGAAVDAVTRIWSLLRDTGRRTLSLSLRRAEETILSTSAFATCAGMIDDQLLVARDLVVGGSAIPSRRLKRAVSTAYYALFHALACNDVADVLDWPPSHRRLADVSPVYRAMDHGTSKKALARFGGDQTVSRREEWRRVRQPAGARYTADYDPAASFGCPLYGNAHASG